MLGGERAAFARAFGRLGDPEEAAAAHRSAGLVEVEARRLHERRAAPGVAAYWAELSAENGHFRKVAAALEEEQQATFLAELEERFAPYRERNGLLAAADARDRRGAAGGRLARSRRRHSWPPGA